MVIRNARKLAIQTIINCVAPAFPSLSGRLFCNHSHKQILARGGKETPRLRNDTDRLRNRGECLLNGRCRTLESFLRESATNIKGRGRVASLLETDDRIERLTNRIRILRRIATATSHVKTHTAQALAELGSLLCKTRHRVKICAELGTKRHTTSRITHTNPDKRCSNPRFICKFFKFLFTINHSCVYLPA